ncbi:carboxypeptidase-like regulatory domain-containing protein [Winogradskyella echinorum]|uniref:Carboxypeptidase-like regulatory domain-containing protein n=1 Tax=Winogradskyella echinorum TaxID=538189 RepID=A0ABR6Y4B0_9FLAO|nr:carboxypeptidase-like regulatory domain-containing protein [Winogradskyella echinorum]MBC3847600.1 carboxypeptidase-like regulatory domain-containing protein [Winogradskyella echinorum]MBC5751948.1 carboxypeptidase-like regulatory domain-containing protein [Winogradskyella echinorum]
MKKIQLLFIVFFLVICSINAQNFDKLWKQVEAKELEGDLEKAIKLTDKIYKKSLKVNNHPNIVKSFIYKTKFDLLVKKDSQNQLIERFEKIIEKTTFPSQAFLENLYAKFLISSYEKNKYRIDQHPKLGIDTDNIHTWNREFYINQIELHFKNSLKQTAELKTINIEDYFSIIEGEANSLKYRPTLYDLFVNDAINFYNKNWMPQNLRHYTSEASSFSANTREFIKVDLPKSDIPSDLNALQLYQDLERFHLKEENFQALFDTYKNRIYFLNPLKTMTKIDSSDMLSTAIQSQINAFKTIEDVSILYYHSANYMYETSNNYFNKNDTIPYRILAYNTCKKAIKEYPNSLGASKCVALNNSLDSKFLKFQIESVSTTNKPALALVEYTNTDSIYLKAYKIPHSKIKKGFHENDSVVFSYIKNIKPHKTQAYQLIDKKDYKKHTAEILIPKLENGNYIIVLSNSKEITSKKNFAYHSTTRTNLFINYKDGPTSHEFQVTNRETGQPIKGAKINIVSKDLKYHIKKKTNTNGFAYELQNESNQYNLTTTVTYKNDTLITNSLRLYGNVPESDWNIYSHVILDRQIYRPGQTVNFKVYLYQNKQGKSSALTNVYCSVVLSDANGNDLKEYRLKVNDFGTAYGSYTLPKDVVTGEFYIEVDEDYDYEEEDHPVWDNYDDFEYTEKTFYVEEYKRPRFEVLFNPVTKNYKLGDSVSISGEAKSFFKTKIINAKVKYVIERYGYGNDKINITGETLTDETGNFIITFPTNYSKKDLNKQHNFYHNYSINVSVTDINGETQTKNKEVNIGNYNLNLRINNDAHRGPQKETTFTLNALNLNDGYTPCEGEFTIYKTKNRRALFSRSWNIPEYQMIPKDTFNFYFSYLKYNNDDYKSDEDELVYTNKFNVNIKEELKVNTLNWESGRYIIKGEARVVGTNETKEISNHFNFKNTDKDQYDKEKLFTYTLDKFYSKDFINFKLNSVYKNTFVTIRAYHRKKEIYNKVINIDEQPFIKIPKKGILSGTIQIMIRTNRYGKIYHETFENSISINNNQFNIETLSFRNRLTPNETETWKFKIDHKNTDVEVLASMYDSSLDTFFDNEDIDSYTYSKDWDLYFETYDNYYNSRPEVLISNMRFKSTNHVFYQYTAIKSRYIQLNSFGLDFKNFEYTNKRYIERLKVQQNLKKLPKGNVNGTVITASDGLPLPGVSVIVKGTTRGAQTDFDGYYSLNVNEGETLVFSYVGMESSEVTYNGNSSIYVALEDDSNLDEVVVVGYGTSTKKAFSGIAVKTSSTYFIPNNSFLDAIIGQAAGVTVIKSENIESKNIIIRGIASAQHNKKTLFVIDGIPVDEKTYAQLNPNDIAGITVLKDATATAIYGSRGANGVVLVTSKYGSELKDLKDGPTVVVLSGKAIEAIETRKDLKETAFFLPNITTDSNNEFEFSFNAPEALTTWKLQLLAHTKNSEFGYLNLAITTTKDLIVTPNFPRFLREGDKIKLVSKVTSQANKTVSGYAYLQLFDADTNTELQLNSKRTFIINSNETKIVDWLIDIPENVDRIRYKIIASADTFSDGEEGILEVLKKKILVTETLPIAVNANTKKEFNIEKLASNTSKTLQNQKLVIEYTTNPIWSAVQSLPYLIDYPFDCAEQTFSKFYANTLGKYLLENNPKLKNDLLELLEEKKQKNIAKSESLKSLLNSEKLEDQELQLISKLDELQHNNGAFSWFSDGNPNQFITRHIVASYGHLIKVGAIRAENNYLDSFIIKAVNYLDNIYFNKIEKVLNEEDSINNSEIIHYLYARSFYIEKITLEENQLNKINKFIELYDTNWVTLKLYEKALYANVCYSFKNKKIAQKIIKNLKASAVKNNDLGMYWKENINGFYWNESQIETHALLIETFVNLTSDSSSIYELKKWLLAKKRTNSWKTTKATTDAIYALLLGQEKQFKNKNQVTINYKTNTNKLSTNKVKSNYKKIELDKNEFNNLSSKVEIKNNSDVIGFGGIYWQYFEDLDKITLAETPLKLSKKLFLKTNTDKGEEISEITSDTKLNVGDLVRVRIELRTDRNMEFVHIKDMRAAGFEPINVLSSYKWQDGLGYYESTKDAATNFFIDYLPKGVYVFEYDIRVNNAGDMSNGISTIQSMYAPEFSSHSEGIRVRVD